jgi:hypothetical protein
MAKKKKGVSKKTKAHRSKASRAAAKKKAAARTATQKRYLAAARRAKKEKSTEAQKELLAAIRELKQYAPPARRRKKGKKKMAKAKKKKGKKKAKRTAAQRAAARANIKKAQKARRGKRHRVKAHHVKAHRVKAHRVKGHTVRSHMSYDDEPRRRRRRHHKRGALENPLSAMELAIGALTGTIGYVAMDSIDRAIASRDGAPLVKAAVGYAAAEAGPIWGDLPRLGAGVAIAAVPFIGAQFIRGPALRSALQFFGFGAAFNVLGKVGTALLAKIMKDSNTGKRLYAQEVASAEVEAGLTGLPEGTDHYARWIDGLGACCRHGPSLETHKIPTQAPTVTAPVAMGPPVVEVPPEIALPQMPPPPPPRTVRHPVPPPSISRQPAAPPPGILQLQPLTAGAGRIPMTLRGLGAPLRSKFQPLIDAIEQNQDAFAAIANSSATEEQMRRATQITTAFAPQIKALDALAGLPVDESAPAAPAAELQKRRNPYRWGSAA